MGRWFYIRTFAVYDIGAGAALTKSETRAGSWFRKNRVFKKGPGWRHFGGAGDD